jgi:hypothetical protein
MYAEDELLDNPDLLISVAQKLKEEREKNKALKAVEAVKRKGNEEVFNDLTVRQMVEEVGYENQ